MTRDDDNNNNNNSNLLLIFKYKILGSDSIPVTEKYNPASILTLHCLIQQSHIHALDPRNTADNKYHVETVREFAVD